MMQRLSRMSVVLIFALLLITSSSLAQELPPVPTVGDAPYAAFIDTYQFAIAQGASAEWRKLEWLALDANSSTVYLAISNFADGMTDGEGDIQYAEGVECGAIFAGTLDADMNIASVEPVLLGGALDEANEANPCDVEAIAGPDNLYVDGRGNVWIGEDTDGHMNNVLWMWVPSSGELKRFATVPLGSEVTGLHIAADGTIFMNIQHPDDTNQEPYNMATVGVIKGYVAGDDFESLSVPATEEEMTTVRVAAGEYQVLARVGDPLPGNEAGVVMGAIIAYDGTVLNICNDPDGNMFLPTEAGKGWLYSNLECGVGGVSQLWIERDADGNWTSSRGAMLDFIPVNGTGNNCGASVTPWNTGLSAEEYPADNEEDWQYWLEEQEAGLEALTGTPANPYDQGYSVELIPAEDGTTQIVKRYAMGRFSQEVAIVMPDNRTVYFGDDGTDRIFFKFVADNAGDLSSGTLYAAKATQDGMVLNLEWIMLGQGNETDIAAAIRELDAEFAN